MPLADAPFQALGAHAAAAAVAWGSGDAGEAPIRVKPARSRHSTPFALLWRWPRSLPGPLRLEPGHSGLAGGLQRRPLRRLHGSAHHQQLRRPHSTATALRSADCGGACRRRHQGAAVPRLGSGSSSGCTPWRTALQAAAAKARSCLCASATSAGQSGCAELAVGCQPPAATRAGRFPLQSLLPAHLCACRSPSAEAVFKSGGLQLLQKDKCFSCNMPGPLRCCLRPLLACRRGQACAVPLCSGGAGWRGGPL